MSYVDEVLGISLHHQGGRYWHSIPKLNLSVERHTRPVPGDGQFYMLHQGQILGSYRSLRQAEEYFYQFVKESQYDLKSLPSKADDIAAREMSRYFRDYSTFF